MLVSLQGGHRKFSLNILLNTLSLLKEEISFKDIKQLVHKNHETKSLICYFKF